MIYLGTVLAAQICEVQVLQSMCVPVGWNPFNWMNRWVGVRLGIFFQNWSVMYIVQDEVRLGLMPDTYICTSGYHSVVTPPNGVFFSRNLLVRSYKSLFDAARD